VFDFAVEPMSRGATSSYQLHGSRIAMNRAKRRCGRVTPLLPVQNAGGLIKSANGIADVTNGMN
jgi:hypothetical protein